MKRLIYPFVLFVLYGCSDAYWVKRSDAAMEQNMYFSALKCANNIDNPTSANERKIKAAYKLKQYGLIKNQPKDNLKLQENTVGYIFEDVSKQSNYIAQEATEIGFVLDPMNFDGKGREMTPFWIGDRMFYIGDEIGITDEYSGDQTSFLKIKSANQDREELPSWMKSNDHVGPVAYSKAKDLVVFSKNILVTEKNSLKSIPNLFFTKQVNGKWSAPERLELGDKKFIYTHPFISENTSTLYFVSNMPGGKGGLDIYELRLDEIGKRLNAQNSGSINTPRDEQFPTLVDEVIYYSVNEADGLGGLDIYAYMDGKSERLLSPFNSAEDDFYPVMDSNGSWFISSNRNDDKGQDRIYRFTKVNQMVLVRFIHGESGEILSGTEISMQHEDHKHTFTASGNGNYLDVQQDYTINAEGFETKEFKGTDLSNSLLIRTMDIVLQPKKVILNDEVKPLRPEVGKDITELIQLKPIYFDKSSFDIRSDAQAELDKVAKFMKEHPSIKIECRSHTDCRSSASSNLTLSNNRSKSAVNYLKVSGIAAERLSYKGFGESQPLNDCTCEGKQKTTCSEEELAVNRRLEFIVIE